jgi:branched-chain amino acid transport system permease protein
MPGREKLPSLRGLIAPAIVLIAAFVLFGWIRPHTDAYYARVAMNVGIAIIMAVSLNIVNGYTGQFSLGHAAFFAIGGYAAAGITYYTSIELWNSPATHAGLFNAQSGIFFLATIVGGLVAAGAGWLVGLPSLRLRGDYLAIVTLGFGEIVRVLLQQTNAQLYSQQEIAHAKWSDLFPPPLNAARSFNNIPNVTNFFWTTLFVGACLIFAWRLKRSTFGRAMIAIRENEVAAEAMGVNITRLKVWAFVFAAFFAGIAGSLYAHLSFQLNPGDSGIQRSIDAVIMVVLGGLGSISGSVLAAILLTVGNEWLREPTHIWHIALGVMIIRLIVWPTKRLKSAVWWIVAIGLAEGARSLALRQGLDPGDYRMILYALALVLMMILRPSGLFGTKEITDLPAMRRKLLDRQPAAEVAT